MSRVSSGSGRSADTSVMSCSWMCSGFYTGHPFGGKARRWARTRTRGAETMTMPSYSGGAWRAPRRSGIGIEADLDVVAARCRSIGIVGHSDSDVAAGFGGDELQRSLAVLQVLVTPLHQGQEHRQQILSCWSEAVFVTGALARFPIRHTGNDSGRLQLFDGT